MKVGIILNLNASRVRLGFFSKSRIERILGSPSGSGKNNFYVFEAKNLTEFQSILQYLKDEKVDVISLVGGDGSFKYLLDNISLFWKDENDFPMIIPIKGGSMNVLHKNVFPKQSAGSVFTKIKYFLNDFDSPKNLPPSFIKPLRSIMIISDKIEGGMYGFMFGCGVVWKSMLRYYQMGTGPKKAMELIGAVIAGFVLREKSAIEIAKPVWCNIKIDGEKYPYSKMLAAVASSFKKLVLFTKPFVAERWKDGFYFLAVSEDAWFCIRNFKGIATGKKNLQKSFNNVASEVEMSFEGGFTVDGEVYGKPKSISQVKITQGIMVKFLDISSIK